MANKRIITNEEWERKRCEVHASKEDLNALVMNFLVTEGYLDAAKTFEEESGTALGTCLESSTDRMHIRNAVQCGNIEEAIERVNDLNPEILEEDAPLFFHLQQQRLIELIRQGSIEEALAFAQEYLAPKGEEHPEFLEDLERTIALVAFEDAAASPVGDLMATAQRQKTASELNAAILAKFDQEQEPRLPALMKMLTWAQDQLENKAVFPKMDDLSNSKLREVK